MLKLPRMNNLAPTLDSTILKLVEESGELARAVLNFQAAASSDCRSGCLQEVVGELLDVAQTCVTMLFVLEEFYEIEVGEIFAIHLQKLVDKGYKYDRNQEYGVANDGDFKYLEFPRLLLKADIVQTLCKIQEELGELTQYIGKHGGASGEKHRMTHREIIFGAATELCDVAQCCFTMLYILEETLAVDVGAAQDKHISKLQRKGYLR